VDAVVVADEKGLERRAVPGARRVENGGVVAWS
jgi:hypothetical protein